LSLTVNAPSITLTAGAGTASIVQGQTATVPVTITRAGGFTDAVSVAVTGLPTGITASPSPLVIAAGSTTGTITLSASGTATVGAAALTLTASGTGVTAQTSTVALTVTAAATPAISLGATPAAVSVQAGAVGTSTITLTRSGGFAGDVALAVSGAPTGVTATVAPAAIASGATTATLSLNVGAGAAAGQYNVTVTGTGTGVSNATATVALTVTAAPSIAITAAPTTLTLAAGATATSVVTLVRTNFTGDVALAAGNLPTGVTAAFAPASLTGTTLTSTLTLTAAANASLVTQNITVTATGTGVTAATASVGTTVSAAQSYSLSATSVTAQQGGTASSTVTITRTGGYAGAVTLAVTNLPTGVTASISPNGTTGNSSTITYTVAGNATVGAGTITVTGTGAGLTGNVTTTAGVTVTASGGGGSGNVSWTFCAADRFPSWFAYQNGTSGAWTTVTPTGTTTRVYTFNVSSVGGVAYAIPMGSGSTGTLVTVQYLTQSEMAASGTQECSVSRAKVNLTGTVAGLSTSNPLAAQAATISVGFATASASANGPFTVTGAPSGLSDLLAVRSTTSISQSGFTQTPDKVILRRNTNYTTTIPAIDFATEGVTPASATYTISNLSGEQFISATSIFATANGSTGSFSSTNLSGSAAMTIYGLPNGSLQSGDQHQVLISAIGSVNTTATSARLLYTYNQQLANRTVTLGAAPPALTPTSLGTSPYVRFTATGNWQTDYPDAVGIGYTQATTNSNAWSMSLSRGYAGAGSATWTMALPDFSGVSGFQNSWGMGALSTNWAFTASGILSGLNTTTGQFGEGGSWRAASRTGTITP
jgi:hypothetical protein